MKFPDPHTAHAAFYRNADVSKITREMLLGEVGDEGMRPLFSFAVEGFAHRIMHLLQPEDYFLTEGVPQSETVFVEVISDRTSLLALPAGIMTRDNLLTLRETYYEGNMVKHTWADCLAARGFGDMIYPSLLTKDDVLNYGLIRAAAKSGHLKAFPPADFSNTAFRASQQIRDLEADKDYMGHPYRATNLAAAFHWLAKVYSASVLAKAAA